MRSPCFLQPYNAASCFHARVFEPLVVSDKMKCFFAKKYLHASISVSVPSLKFTPICSTSIAALKIPRTTSVTNLYFSPTPSQMGTSPSYARENQSDEFVTIAIKYWGHCCTSCPDNRILLVINNEPLSPNSCPSKLATILNTLSIWEDFANELRTLTDDTLGGLFFYLLHICQFAIAIVLHRWMFLLLLTICTMH